MKRTLLLTVVGMMSVSMLMAQLPAITATNQIPVIGDSVTYSDANTFGFDPDGSGGALNVMWDYQSLGPTGTISFWYEDPSTTTESANFPTATLAQANSVTTDGYEYFETTASTISRLGYTDPAVASIYYTAGWNRYQFDIDPGVFNNQTYTGTMTSLGAGEDSVTIDNGNYQSVGDAYGTVKLPAQVFGGPPEIFDDVIRVHVIETFQIKAWLFGTPALTINVTDDYYFFFDDLTSEPILIYGVTTDDAGGSPQTVLRYQPITGTGTATGITVEDPFKVSVYPNPATDVLTVELADVNGDASVTVSTLLGRTVETQTVNSGVNKTQLDISDLAPGIYTVSIKNDNNTVSKKIVVR